MSPDIGRNSFGIFCVQENKTQRCMEMFCWHTTVQDFAKVLLPAKISGQNLLSSGIHYFRQFVDNNFI